MEDQFGGEKNNRELVMELLSAFNSFKHRLEDPNYVQMENAIRQMMEGQKEMKEDISELKRQLLNPFDGVIVETRKNTDFREEYQENRMEMTKLVEEHKALVRWKANMQKVGVAILTSAGAVVAWILSEFVIKK